MASRPESKKRSGKTNKKSDAMLLAVVDETLEQVFKGVGVQVIYASFEKNFHLKREDVVKNPTMFSAGLEKLLGSAAVVIEKLIIKNICQRIGLDQTEVQGFQFSDRINDLRRKMSLVEEKAVSDLREKE